MIEEKAKQEAAAEKPPKGKFVDIKITSKFVAGNWIPVLKRVYAEKDVTPEMLLKDSKLVIYPDGTLAYTRVDGKHLRFDGKTGALLSVLLAALISLFSFMPSASAQGVGRARLKIASTEAPYVTLDGITTSAGTGYGRATLLTVNYTTGKVYLGDTAVAVTGGHLTGLTASQGTCTAPAFSACNVIYSDSSGTVATSLYPLVAYVAGNTVLAFVQTNTTKVTEIRHPWEVTLTSPYILLTASTGVISPGNTSGAIETVGQAFALTGLASGDKVALVSQPSAQSLCPATSARATGTDELTIYFTALTAAACTPKSGTYVVSVMR